MKFWFRLAICFALCSCNKEDNHSSQHREINGPGTSIPSASTNGNKATHAASPLILESSRMLEQSAGKGGKFLFDMISGKYSGAERARIMNDVFVQCGRDNPALAVELFEACPEGADKHHWFAGAIFSASSSSSLAILIVGLKDAQILETNSRISSSIQMKLSQLPVGELKMLEKELPSSFYPLVTSKLFGALGREQNAAEFATLLNSISDIARPGAIENYISGLAGVNADAALSFVQSNTANTYSDEILSRVAGSLYSRDPQNGVKKVMTLPESEIGKRLLNSYVNIWFHASSEEFSRYVDDLPSGDAKDILIMELIGKLDSVSEKEEIHKWTSAIKDESLRRSAERN